MSHIQYDPARFVLARLDGATWTPLPAASFSYAADYSPDPNQTLILGAETVAVALSCWGEPAGVELLHPLDVIRADYDGVPLGRFTIDSVTVNVIADPAARRYGATVRTDVAATGVGAYAAALDTMVTWSALPEELAITRIRRWVTVTGW